MDVLTLALFALTVLIGTYFQSVTGFAMGMIITAAAGGSRLLPLPELTAAVSLMSLVNVTLALRGDWGQIDRRLIAPLAAGQVPGIALGLWLLLTLNVAAQHWLYLLLGLFIVLGSLSMTLRPQPLLQRSGATGAALAGLSGGVVGGLFSASGPVMGWFNYRQPLPVRSIRATLLACFMVTTSVRTLYVGVQGGLTLDVWTLVALALPLVVIGTWLGREYPPRLHDAAMKRLAFVALSVMGLAICGQALFALGR